MVINWFTVIAQIVNFFVLVWLLRRYLYKPVLGAIDAREKKIADQVSNAAKLKAEAKKEQEEFRNKNDAFDKEKDDMLAKAQAEVKKEHDSLLAGVQMEVSKIREASMDKLQTEQKDLQKTMVTKIQHAVFDISRKTLSDLASMSLEKQMAEVFTDRLSKIDDDQKKALLNAASKAGNAITVKSAFEIDKVQQKNLQKTFHDAVDPDISLVFEIDPDFVNGIGLQTTGYQMNWSSMDYLDALEKSSAAILDHAAKPVSHHAKKTHKKAKKE